MGSPVVGHKGFGLGLVVDILAGALSGGGCSQADPPESGNALFFTVYDITAFRELDEHLELTPHWGRGIPDPVLSVTGHVKEAEFSWSHGNTHVTQRDLELLPQSAGYATLEQSLGTNLARKLMDGPVAAFKGIKDDHKKLNAPH